MRVRNVIDGRNEEARRGLPFNLRADSDPTPYVVTLIAQIRSDARPFTFTEAQLLYFGATTVLAMCETIDKTLVQNIDISMHMTGLSRNTKPMSSSESSGKLGHGRPKGRGRGIYLNGHDIAKATRKSLSQRRWSVIRRISETRW
ncbi:hypothetical protein SeMB42_g05014 [Synchytrium endobioticum]|uniref:Uncharacterized protein n=1 Tax=Synchytrium endobioticum TaxID=286115 RepID=A0A507CU91_9FUNG|nr:hypothetical protein SeMB42_g05014 [Synchytrium endobioticum]